MQVIERLQQYPGVKQSVDYLSSWIGSYNQLPEVVIEDTSNAETEEDTTLTEDKEVNVTLAQTNADNSTTPDEDTKLDEDIDATEENLTDTTDGRTDQPLADLPAERSVGATPAITIVRPTTSDPLPSSYNESTSYASSRLSRSDMSSASDSDTCGCRSCGTDSDPSYAMVSSGRRRNNNMSRRKRSTLQNKMFARRTRLLYQDIDGQQMHENAVLHVRRAKDVILPRIDSVEEISLSERVDDETVIVRQTDVSNDTVDIELLNGDDDQDLLSSGSIDLSSDWSEYTLSIASVGLECRESDAASVSCVSQDGQSLTDVPVANRRPRRNPLQIGHAVNESFVDKECFHCTIL